MDGHGCGPEDHNEIDTDFIEGWHWKRPELTPRIAWFQITTLWLANG
jgi:hypothetical protein